MRIKTSVLFVLTAIACLLSGHLECKAADLRIGYPQRSPEGLATVTQEARDLPVVYRTDVVVVGGGVAGVTAATVAADAGASVVLIEPRNHFGYEMAGPDLRVTTARQAAPAFPAAETVCDLLVAQGVYRGRYVNGYLLKRTLAGMVASRPKIRALLYSVATGAVVEAGTVRGVVIANRSGRQVVLAKVVIDATDDARVAAAAGARFSRTLTGEKTVKRLIFVKKEPALVHGNLDVPAGLGLIDNQVMVHASAPVIELTFRAKIGDNRALDMASAQADSLKKAVAVIDHLDHTPAAFRSGKLDPEQRLRDHFRLGAEALIKEMPVVVCRKPLGEKDAAALNLSAPDLFLAAGVENLVIAGEAASEAIKASDLQLLVISGEQAGRAALKRAATVEKLPKVGKPHGAASKQSSGTQVRELLGGVDAEQTYAAIREPARKLPVIDRVDVVVVGGGTSGAPAAITAARAGASVALVEVLPNLGGTASNRVTGYYWGVTWRSRLTKEVDDLTRYQCRIRAKRSFSGEEKKLVFQELARRAGVKIYYGTLGAGMVMDGDKATGVVIESAAGRQVIRAGAVIDATGSADLAVAAGASFTKGRQRDGLMHEVDRNGLRDPMNVEDLSRFFIRRPQYSISMNLRESRLVEGDHRVTFRETLSQTPYTDLVCKWRSNYDTHFPSSANQSDLAQDLVVMLGLWRMPIVGRTPYRSLLPKGLDNILVVAKSFSTDHDAMIIARMQRDLQHLGEAAGTAAAMAAKSGSTTRGVDVGKLQRKLVELGVLRPRDLDEASAPAADFDPAEAVKLLGTDEAVGALAELYLAGPKVVDAVRPLLASDDPLVRADAALILGIHGDRAAVPELLACLKRKEARSHVFTLVDCSSRRSVPMYCSSVILLGRFKVKEAVPPIVGLLADPANCSPALASFAIVALERIGEPAAVEAIRPYLKQGQPLPRPDDPLAKQPNENAGFESEWGVRTNAARALAALGDQSGVPLLIELLSADQSLVRAYAHRLLEQITAQSFGSDATRWRAWWAKQRKGTGGGSS